MPFGSTTRTICGTPEFMAPEILEEQPYDRAVDWWAYGVLMYEMLLGRAPFSGEEEDDIYDSILEDEPLYPPGFGRHEQALLQSVSLLFFPFSDNYWVNIVFRHCWLTSSLFYYSCWSRCQVCVLELVHLMRMRSRPMLTLEMSTLTMCIISGSSLHSCQRSRPLPMCPTLTLSSQARLLARHRPTIAWRRWSRTCSRDSRTSHHGLCLSQPRYSVYHIIKTSVLVRE